MGPAIAFLGSVFFGVGLAGASAAYLIAVNLARLGLLALASKYLAPKIDLQQTAVDKLLTVKSSIAPQAFVYGQEMLSGPLIFANVSGESNEHLHRLIALTGREIDSYVGFRVDDTDIDIPTHIADANDSVTAGQFADVMDIATQLGTSTQTVLTQLNTDFSSLWTSAHRGRGWSQLYTRMTIVGGNTAYEKGIPQNIRAIVKGHKVYDPRLDVTQIIDSTTSPVTYGSASPSQSVTDSSTWAWSDNPALCLADWLMWDEVGMGEETDRIDWELVAKAADICEQQVLVPPSASPSNYQDRYTCNFVFYADQERGQVKSILEEAMLGRCIFSQGKWRMFAGAARTATVTLTEENLAGGIQVEASTGAKERYNTVRGKFVDPTRDYTAASYPEITDAAYVTDDGEKKYKTVDFNACNNSYEAQRNAIIVNRQSRNQKIVRFEGNWSCFQIQTGDVVEMNIAELGWSATSSPITTEKFLVTEWSLDKDGRGVTLTLVEETDSVWNDPAIGDYTTRSATGVLTAPGVPAVALSDATIHNPGTSPIYAGVRAGADGRLRYGNGANVYYDRLVPPNEWLGSGTDIYSIKATVTSGSLASGTEDTWETLDADRTWFVAVDTTVSPVYNTSEAIIDLSITNDTTASPIPILTSATYTLCTTESIFGSFYVGVGNVGTNSGGGTDANAPSGTQSGDKLYALLTRTTAPTGWSGSYAVANNMNLFSRTASGTSADNLAGSDCGVLTQIFAFRDNASYTIHSTVEAQGVYGSQTAMPMPANNAVSASRAAFIIYGGWKTCSSPSSIDPGSVDMTESGERLSSSVAGIIGYKEQSSSTNVAEANVTYATEQSSQPFTSTYRIEITKS